MEERRRHVLDLLAQALHLMDQQGDTLAAARISGVIDDLMIEACNRRRHAH